uniref:Obscurin, cytoskeletal calmodulin and titin-interacting RhoGEF b n=1 Tax=Myripristis murdjan TaxID=586833 RepID=A0A668A7J7_9TELE
MKFVSGEQIMDQNLFGGAPRFLTRPKAFAVCVGKDATLSCTIVGSPTPLITWEKEKLKLTSGGRFKTVEDGDVYRLTIYDLTLEDSGQYMCRAKNSVGEAYAAVTLKVALPTELVQRAPVFMVKPTSARVGLGGDVIFHCRVAAHPDANFDWEKDGRYLAETNRIKIVSDSDSSSLRIQSVRNLDSGTYTCRAQNSVGRAQAAAALVVDTQDSRHLGADKNTSLLSHLQKRKEEMKKDISIYHTEDNSSLVSSSTTNMADGLSALSLEHDLRASTLAKLPKGVFTRTCTVTEGKHAKLSCFVTGHPKPHIIWRKDGTNISEGRRHVIYEDQAENFILKILYCKQSDNGLYTCNATNMAGQTYSAVLVIVKGNITKKLPRRTVVPISDTVIFCVELEHPCPDAYWTRNGEKLKEDSRVSIACMLRQYTLTIRDCQADDSGEVAFVTCVKSARKHPPDPPVDAVVQNKTDSSITLQWSPPDSDRPVPIKSYIVDRKKVGAQTWQRCNATETIVSTEMTICNFTEEATYQFRISAINDFGQSPYLEVPGSFYLEPRAEVRKGLMNSTAVSGEEASLSVELSAVCSGFWSLNGRLLRSGGDYLITRSKNIHTLVIRTVSMDLNGAEVKFVETLPQAAFSNTESVQKEVTAILSHKATLSCDVSDSKTEVKWYKDGKLLVSSKTVYSETKGKTRQLVIENVEKNDAGEYICESAFFNKESVQKEVKAILSQKATLSCEVADAKTEVKWYKDGKLLTSSRTIHAESKGKSRQLVIDSVEKKDAGEYICEAGTEKLVFKILFSSDTTLSQKATLSCEVADAKTEVKWYKDGKLLTSSRTIHAESKGKSRQLVIDSVEKKDAGEYICEAGAEKLAFKMQVSVQKEVKTTLSQKATLSCEVADAKTDVKWYKDGKLLTSSRTIHVESKGKSRQLVIDSVEKKDAGEYICEAGTEKMAVFVFPSERIVAPMAVKATLSQKATLSCEVADAKTEVKWYKDGKLLTSSRTIHAESKGKSRQLVIDSVEKKDAGEYICEAGTEKLVFKVQVEVQKEVKATLSQKATLSCEVADAKTEVKWYKDGKLLTSSRTIHVESKGKSRQLVIDSVEKKDAGEYICEAGAEKLAFKVQVAEAPAAFSNKESVQKEVKATLSQKATLSCEVSDSKTEVKWYKDGKLLTSSKTVHMESKGKSRQLVIEKMEKKDAGEYTCEAGTEKLVFKLQVTVITLYVEHHKLTTESANVKWFRDGVEIKEGNKYEIKIDGLSRTLIIKSSEAKDSGAYSCQTADDKLEFKVQVPLKFVAPLKPVTIDLGGTLSLMCELNQASGDVVWQHDGRDIKPGGRFSISTEGAKRFLTVTDMAKEDEGEYSCECKNDKTSAKVSSKAPRLVRLTAKLNNVVAVEGKEAIFKCSVTPADASVKWFRNNVPITAGPKYKIEHGVFLLIAFGFFSFSLSFFVPPSEIPVTFKKKLENLTVEEQVEVKLEVELSKPSADVKWMKNSVVLQPTGNMEIRVDGTKQTLVFKSVTHADRGFYSCETLDDKTEAKLTVESKAVELNQADVEGSWTRNGTKIKTGPNCRITALGKKHALTLSQLKMEDAGTIAFQAEGVRTSGKLIVTEPPAMISNPMMDISVPEKEKVTFECEVSRSNADVKWFKGDMELKPGKNFSIHSLGRKRTLVIQKCAPEDQGTYICRTSDDNTSAKLTVHGNSKLLFVQCRKHSVRCQ